MKDKEKQLVNEIKQDFKMHEEKHKQIEEMRFKVIDNNTGKEADICEIALNEDWAKDLIYCDMQGFAILDDGNLVLLDECGKYVYCPNGRFSVIPENAVVLKREEWKRIKSSLYYSEEECERRNQKIRKETAEKYHKAMRKVIHERDYIEGYAEIGLQEENDEIAKQFGVEIKE